MTKRQEIFQFLTQADFSAKELSKASGIKEKDVYDHLHHIEKSAKTKSHKFKIIPAQCVSCEFTFKKRERLTRPSRCPKCKKQQIDPPRFQIV
ncbi:MAG: transcriptional regulator [Candidatus Magnetoglobus multicellularis str. Araruama]|uniref:Transcriptional regulator n=1 Tax=Candidatus Magnetoglobus multicellularis str. Araruama TaxID=890399 RepID=A0A1V1PE73_9BACT|nr:MAG: transcriptional regulator [Candidatus Magnetoglobus multicellularis str. Araruama]